MNEIANESESQICQQICKWLTKHKNDLKKNGNPIVWFKVRNEFTGKPNAIYGARMKREGVRAGVFDYAFLSKDWAAMVEIKTKKGVVSQAQKDFKADLESACISCAITRSLEETKDMFKEWGVTWLENKK